MPLLTIRESHTIVKLGERMYDNWMFYTRPWQVPPCQGVYPEAVPGASGVAREPCRLAAISQKDRRE